MPCYIATLRVERIDGKKTLLQHSLLTKRIFVADPGTPPRLVTNKRNPLNKDLYARVGERADFVFQNVTDHENPEVIFNIKLGGAARFTTWDESKLTLSIAEGATIAKRDVGVHPIQLELIEVIRGVRMPAYYIDVNITIGTYEPPPPPPIVYPEPLNLPRVKISKFLMNGLMTITFSEALGFPENLLDEIDIQVQPGSETDPALLGFNFNITSTEQTAIEIKFTFDNPLEISQLSDPEKVKVALNLESFKHPDDIKMQGYVFLTSFIPRQIPSEAEAAAIESSGSSTEDGSTAVMSSNFFISLLMAASLNQLWSMLNGLQLAVHLPLFATPFPANANYFITFIITVATFDILPEEVMPLIFDFPAKESYRQSF